MNRMSHFLRGWMLLAVAVGLPSAVLAQTNYYWQTIARNVAVSGGPQGLAVDTAGNVYLVATFESTILKATPTGTNWNVTTIAGLTGVSGTNDGIGNVARFNAPDSLALEDSNTLFVADTGNNAIREVEFDGTNWNVTTIAGVCGGGTAGSLDGTNQFAQFYYPAGVAVDSQGNLYVADENNDTIREIVRSGTNWITTTIAGSAGSGGWTDGTNEAAQFNAPVDVAVNGGGDLFVADYNNNIIREIEPVDTNWVTTTIAGNGNEAFADGTNEDSELNGPFSVAVDNLNNVYVADVFNNAIRKLYPVGTNWVTVTIGGSGFNGGVLEDGTNIMAQFSSPYGVAVDSAGNVYVGDTGNDALRLGYFYPALLQLALAGQNLTLSYPFAVNGNFNFILQSATDLRNANWSNITNNWQFTTSGIPFVNLAITNNTPPRFFRLELP